MECTDTSTRLTNSDSSARLEGTVYQQTASITAFAKGAVVCLFRDADPARESSLDTIVISSIQTILDRVVANGFQSRTVCLAIE